MVNILLNNARNRDETGATKTQQIPGKDFNLTAASGHIVSREARPVVVVVKGLEHQPQRICC